MPTDLHSSAPVIPIPAASLAHGGTRRVAAAAVGFAEARNWFALAIASLVVAGLLSLSVVIGRIPVINRLIDDPLFFKRCLVVHVILALVVWFYAFVGALLCLRSPGGNIGLRQLAFHAAVAGVAAMLGGALMRGAQPILANYIPVIDHPFFLTGIGLFFGGVLLLVLTVLMERNSLRGPTLLGAPGIGLTVVALALVLAGATWLAAFAGIPRELDAATFYEFTGWGAGHVLQVANAAAMLAVWLWLLERATGRAVVSPGRARLLFFALVAPHFAMPLLTAKGTLDTLYHSGATQLMRWGIFPIVLVTLGFSFRHIWRSRLSPQTDERSTLLAGFRASAGLTLLGFALGACIRNSSTLVPAHYHASLGAVTVAFMTAAYVVAQYVRPPHSRVHASWRMARWQLLLFGTGQSVFAVGFAIGGVYGLGRKAYAAEQHVRTSGEYVGLFVMGAGGLIAVAGGLWFLALMVREIRSWRPVRSSCVTPLTALSR